jgi:hypothetical protein
MGFVIGHLALVIGYWSDDTAWLNAQMIGDS